MTYSAKLEFARILCRVAPQEYSNRQHFDTKFTFSLWAARGEFPTDLETARRSSDGERVYEQACRWGACIEPGRTCRVSAMGSDIAGSALFFSVNQTVSPGKTTIGLSIS